MSELSNHDWILQAIANATLIERLTILSHEIKMDQEAGIDYTLDNAAMNEIRKAWADKKRELTK